MFVIRYRAGAGNGQFPLKGWLWIALSAILVLGFLATAAFFSLLAAVAGLIAAGIALLSNLWRTSPSPVAQVDAEPQTRPYHPPRHRNDDVIDI